MYFLTHKEECILHKENKPPVLIKLFRHENYFDVKFSEEGFFDVNLREKFKSPSSELWLNLYGLNILFRVFIEQLITYFCSDEEALEKHMNQNEYSDKDKDLEIDNNNDKSKKRDTRIEKEKDKENIDGEEDKDYNGEYTLEKEKRRKYLELYLPSIKKRKNELLLGNRAIVEVFQFNLDTLYNQKFDSEKFDFYTRNYCDEWLRYVSMKNLKKKRASLGDLIEKEKKEEFKFPEIELEYPSIVFSLDFYLNENQWKDWMNQQYNENRNIIDKIAQTACPTKNQIIFLGMKSFTNYNKDETHKIFIDYTGSWGRPIWYFRHMTSLLLQLTPENFVNGKYNLDYILLGMKTLLLCLPCDICLKHVIDSGLYTYLNNFIRYYEKEEYDAEIDVNETIEKLGLTVDSEGMSDFIMALPFIYKEFLIHNKVNENTQQKIFTFQSFFKQIFSCYGLKNLIKKLEKI
ncbi:MAG: hypothetical protein QM535_14980 [Limnohabitans sp.]|nr:hypothetical protein [Limnohabitans sp.]